MVIMKHVLSDCSGLNGAIRDRINIRTAGLSVVAAMLALQAAPSVAASSVVPIYPNYCADNTGGTVCPAANFASWIAAGSAPGAVLYAQAGIYRLSAQQTVHLGPTGLNIICDGPQVTQFAFDSGVASPNIVFEGNDNAPSTPATVTGLSIEGCGITGAVNGTLAQFGWPDFGDKLYHPRLVHDLFINSAPVSGPGVALQLNYVDSGTVDVIAQNGNLPGAPYNRSGFAALDCRQCTNTNFFGLFQQAYSAIMLRDGINSGNTFHSVVTAHSVVGLNVANTSSHANTLVGGLISDSTYGIFASGGSSNQIINPTFQQVTTPGGSCVGIQLQLSTASGGC